MLSENGSREAAVKGLEQEGLGEIPAANAGATGEHDAAFSWRVVVGLSELGDRLGEPFGVRSGVSFLGRNNANRKHMAKRMPRWFNGGGQKQSGFMKNSLFLTLAGPLTAAPCQHIIDNTSRGADGVRLLDINNDKRLDIATGWEEGGVIRAYLHPGNAKVTERWPMIEVGK